MPLVADIQGGRRNYQQATPDQQQVLGANERCSKHQRQATDNGAYLCAGIDEWRQPFGLQRGHVLVHVEGGVHQQQFRGDLVGQVIDRVDQCCGGCVDNNPAAEDEDDQDAEQVSKKSFGGDEVCKCRIH